MLLFQFIGFSVGHLKVSLCSWSFAIYELLYFFLFWLSFRRGFSEKLRHTAELSSFFPQKLYFVNLYHMVYSIFQMEAWF